MVNAGAIAVAELIDGGTRDERAAQHARRVLGSFAGRTS